MTTLLKEFEDKFLKRLATTKPESRNRPGCLLPAIPNRGEWDQFLKAAKGDWDEWKKNPAQQPACLIILFGGLAFYEYEDATFWPKLATAVGLQSRTPPLALYNKLNRAYVQSVSGLGFPIPGQGPGMSYVGTAVQHIPIIQLIDDGATPPHLFMTWPKQVKNVLIDILKKRGVRLVNNLWIP